MSEIKLKPAMLNMKNMQIAIVASFILQPFEVLQTSMIATKYSSHNINFKGLTLLIKEVIAREGIHGFFRGTTLSIIKNTISYSLFFAGIENYKPKDNQSLFVQSVVNLIIAASSKLVATTLVAPLAVMKTKMQIVGRQEYNGIVDCAKKIKINEGYGGFYKGLIPTILRDVPYTGIQYSIYRSLLGIVNFVYEDPHKHSGIVAGCASSGSIVAILLTYPFDNLRIRQQAQQDDISLTELSRQLYKSEGIKGFYQGYLPRLMKRGLQSGVLWSVYEKVMLKNKKE